MTLQIQVNECPCCGSHELDSAHESKKFQVDCFPDLIEYQYVICSRCTHYFVLNPLSQDSLDTYYNTSLQMRREEVSEVELAVFDKQYSFIESKVSKEKLTVLEVGCDTGQLLDYISSRADAETFYCESSTRAVEIIERNGRHKDVSLLPDGKADIVIARHVLEHVVDPVEFLRFLSSKTHDESFIMVEVPDMTEFGSGCDGIYFEHLHYFTVASISRLFNECGMRPVAIEFDQTEGYGTTENRVIRFLARRKNMSELTQLKGAAEHFSDLNGNLYRQAALLGKQYPGKLALYPASWISKDILLNSDQVNETVRYVFDGDDAKWGRYMLDKEISPPVKIPESDVECILVTSSYYKEITRDIRKTGFSGQIVYYADILV